MNKPLAHLLFWLFGALCFTPWLSAPVAMLLGMVVAATTGVPAGIDTSAWVKRLLGIAIVALGFGMQVDSALQVTGNYLGLIVVSIVATLLAAWALWRWLGLDAKTGVLIGSGTAICGGSAIAAVAPAIRARNDQIAIAIGCVFTLNAVALLVFPVLGRLFELSPETFGVWAAVAIHDTSSVVGAAEAFHDDALITATTLKLARALWIIPLAFGAAWLYQRQQSVAERAISKTSVPWFLVGYVISMLIATYLPQGEVVYGFLFSGGKLILVFCLFLVGTHLTLAKIRQAAGKPMLLATLLWLFIAGGSLLWLLR